MISPDIKTLDSKVTVLGSSEDLKAILDDQKIRRVVRGLLAQAGVDSRTRELLVREGGFRSVNAIMECSDDQLDTIPYIGRKRIEHIRQALSQANYPD